MNHIILKFRAYLFACFGGALLSLIIHFVSSMFRYSVGKVSFAVRYNNLDVKTQLIDSYSFVNEGYGVLDIKPNFLQALLFNDRIYKDSGIGAIYIMFISVIILFLVRANKNNLSPKLLYTYAIWLIVGFFAFKIVGNILVGYYVADFTNGQFSFNRAFFEFDYIYLYFAVGAFYIFRQIADYSTKLKQENDLTI